MQRPKLRDNRGAKPFELYPIGQIPDKAIFEASKWLAYYYATGRSDISGKDWGDIFAKAIGGEHMGSPLGLADVIYEGMAWSVKTVSGKPGAARTVRLISGRNNVGYSLDNLQVFEDIAKTGADVLKIWNERVALAKEKYEPLRACVLIRDFTAFYFKIFEKELFQFDPCEFEWRVNDNKNFNGYHKDTGEHRFIWQSEGKQFTIIEKVPSSAKAFSIRRPSIEFDAIMERIQFDNSWVTIE